MEENQAVAERKAAQVACIERERRWQVE